MKMKQKQFIENYKNWIQKDRKKALWCLGRMGFIIIAFIVVLIVSIVNNNTNESIVYRETTVQSGNLTVGITEDGTVDIGTVDQTFDLDISALVRNTSSSSSDSGSIQGNSNQGMSGSQSGSNGQGGMDMFSQMMALANGTEETKTADKNDLIIDKICVTVGQQINKGDELYLLTEDSVSDIRTQLETDVTNAKADLDMVYADQKVSTLTASNTYDSSVAYGSYAQTEYDVEVAKLETAVTTTQEEIDLTNKEIEDTQARLEELNAEYATVLETYKAFKWSAENTDKSSSTAQYLSYVSSMDIAKTMVDSYETSIETAEDTIEKDQDLLVTLKTDLAKANRELETGKLEAKKTYDLRMLAYQTAQETYDVATALLEVDTSKQEDTYQDAVDKLEEFNSTISDNAVISEYSGIITDIYLEADDSIDTNGQLITLYDQSDMTMTVDVDDDDVKALEKGGDANITFTTFPDSIYNAEITDIGDAQTDSSGNVTYAVTVTLSGDVSGLYQGMTGELTFITKQSQKVLYVSNRAITRRNNKSYIKMKDNNGKIIEKEVTTGFSDGINVEIKEGLSEGEVVLIESKVSD